MLRIDDTDDERSTGIRSGDPRRPGWLGIGHDIFARQSDRVGAVRSRRREAEGERPALSLLRNRRGARPPAQAPARGAASRRSMTAPRLTLTDAERAKLEAEGPQAALALQAQRRARSTWNDLIRGAVEIDTAHLSDPVLIREDGAFSTRCLRWSTTSISRITHVIRGEDHVTNTARADRDLRGAGRDACRPSRISRC